ncbi:isochorismatase family protein [Rhodoplanes sp. TEM]|uniref:Isochorismatase family protein n=1 Tax=Rhodoplanes tepidamans TaxID=200616 RepID=A0ABT5JEP7_RHOTP|nr:MULTISPECIES: isochorismatase family protein [Rhodoplanes]MDC7788160.1 isochorismatase family protein [Rhodoplanes tepidamans]MDC7988070.1 isochorismatase family protein [Rhodoplanes sp. TEM]MDQ0355150.1 nicotinamidase-related amidase [Rhodoplanes tepidamans]
MPTIDSKRSTLVVVDFQERLMPAIAESETAIANARRLLDAAALIGIPVVFTEQNPKGLGRTVAALPTGGHPVVTKSTFDSVPAPGFIAALAPAHALVIAGCEAHVCVCQTVLGLLTKKRQVYVVRDAVGSRRAESKETALRRMERHGAEIVTTEMVVFEWLESAEHPRFREVAALVK